MAWICESCGAAHGANAPPCRTCGAEVFAQVRDEVVPADFEPGADAFGWVCPACDQVHEERRGRCAACDSLGLDPAFGVDPDSLDAAPRSLVGRALDAAGWLVAFGGGLLATLVGFLFLIGGSPRFGAPVLVAGLVAFPSLRRRLGDPLAGWAVGLLYVAGWLGGLLWYNLGPGG